MTKEIVLDADVSPAYPFMGPLDVVIDEVGENLRRLSTLHLELHPSTDHKVRLRVLKKNATAVPPSYDPVDITGWAAKLVVSADESTPYFAAVTGSIVSPASGGTFEFAVNPGVVAALERGMFEAALYPDGNVANPPQARVQGTATIKVKLL